MSHSKQRRSHSTTVRSSTYQTVFFFPSIWLGRSIHTRKIYNMLFTKQILALVVVMAGLVAATPMPCSDVCSSFPLPLHYFIFVEEQMLMWNTGNKRPRPPRQSRRQRLLQLWCLQRPGQYTRCLIWDSIRWRVGMGSDDKVYIYDYTTALGGDLIALRRSLGCGIWTFGLEFGWKDGNTRCQLS